MPSPILPGMFVVTDADAAAIRTGRFASHHDFALGHVRSQCPVAKTHQEQIDGQNELPTRWYDVPAMHLRQFDLS